MKIDEDFIPWRTQEEKYRAGIPYQDDGTPVFRAIAGALIAPIVLLIVVMILSRNLDRAILFIEGAILLLLVIGEAFLVTFLVIGRNKRRRHKIPDFDDDHLPRITDEDFGRFIGKDKSANLLRPKIAMSKDGIEAMFSEAVLIYTGTLENKLCVFCKLEVRKKQVIYSCPYCVALFHKEHLLEWLTENSSCPVCHGKITIR
ncbi:MAG: hypothetical protein FK733_04350 [Asgard group archaeon]|nr:hypothetical protein [Asgard group archaeon]